jgi:hypothetical protein
MVNDGQKAEILTAMAPNVPAWRRAAIIGAFILSPVLWALAIATLMLAVNDHDEPTGGDVAVMIILVAVPILLALFLAIAWTAQAQLAGDLRRGMTRSISFRTIPMTIALFGITALMSAFALGMRTAQHTFFTASTVLIVVNLAMPAISAKMASPQSSLASQRCTY